MKKLILSAIALSVILFSCSKQNIEETIDNQNKIGVNDDSTPESGNLFYYNIPSQYASPAGSPVGNVQIIQETMDIDGVIYNVEIEYTTSVEGKIISLGVSDDISKELGINNSNFIIDNFEVFDAYYPLAERPDGWLARFFLGKIVKSPCVLGRQVVGRDPWWGPYYVVSGENGDPC